MARAEPYDRPPPVAHRGRAMATIAMDHDQCCFDRDDLRFFTQMVYERGFADGRERSAVDAGAADLSWLLRKRLTHEDHVRRRLVEMAAWRRQAYPGRPDHPGGPVDWDTGRPLTGYPVNVDRAAA